MCGLPRENMGHMPTCVCTVQASPPSSLLPGCSSPVTHMRCCCCKTVAAGRRHMLYRASLRYVWAAPGKHGAYAHLRLHNAAINCTAHSQAAAHPLRARHAATRLWLQVADTWGTGHFCSTCELPRADTVRMSVCCY